MSTAMVVLTLISLALPLLFLAMTMFGRPRKSPLRFPTDCRIMAAA